MRIAPGLARAVRFLPRRALRGRPVRFADVRRFARALRGPQRRSACAAVVDGAIVVTTLERRGLSPLLRGPSTLPEPDPAAVRPIVGAVDAGLGLLPVAPTCLRRSVTLLRELHRRGMGATMHIGVRKADGKVQAHAWVTVAGEVVNDDPDVVGTYLRLSTSQAKQFRANFG